MLYLNSEVAKLFYGGYTPLRENDEDLPYICSCQDFNVFVGAASKGLVKHINVLTKFDRDMEDENLRCQVLACSISNTTPNSNFPKDRIFPTYNTKVSRFLRMNMNPIYTRHCGRNYILHLVSKNNNDDLVMETIKDDPKIPR